MKRSPPSLSPRGGKRRRKVDPLTLLLFVIVLIFATTSTTVLLHLSSSSSSSSSEPNHNHRNDNIRREAWTLNQESPIQTSRLPPNLLTEPLIDAEETASDEDEAQQNNNDGASSVLSDPPPPPRRRPTACVCMLVRSEPQYIEEFVDYHLALGFSNVYIYDNSMDFELESYQNSFPRTEIVHFNNTGEHRQVLGQKRCINRHARVYNHTWVALIDVDEYLVLKQHSNVVDFLQDVCPTNGSVSINWVRFGTANRTKYERLPLTYRFQYRINMSRIVKSIVHVPSYRKARSPHWVYLKQKGTRRDTHGNYIQGDYFEEYGVYNPSWNSKGTIDVAAIHHYMYKSLEEYTQKRCKRGRMSHEYNQVDLLCKNFTLDDMPRGDIHDDLAWQFLKSHMPEKYAKYEGMR